MSMGKDLGNQVNILRDGMFQISMSLYKEYAKYLETEDAKLCVYRDLQDISSKFQEESNLNNNQMLIDALQKELDLLQKEYNKSASSEQRYALTGTMGQIIDMIEYFKNKK